MIWKDYVAQKLAFWKRQNKTAEKTAPEIPLTAPEDMEPAAGAISASAVPPGQAPESEEAAQSPAQADFEAGMLAFKARSYGEALEMLLRAAENGHREAQFICGQFYQRGLAADADCKRALAWYRRAARQGLLQAQLSCAVMYEEGMGTDINMKRALYWYEQAAKQGAVDAQLKCGRMYYYGRAETRNPQKARRWLEMAAGQGCEDAGRMLQEYF